jgi:hypothetical protein
MTIGSLLGMIPSEKYTKPNIVLQFDSSDSSTLFQDINGTIPSKVGDPIRSWKTTSNSIMNKLAVVKPADYLKIITINGFTGIDFRGTNRNGDYYFSYLADLKPYPNATLIVVGYLFPGTTCGHFWEFGDAWIYYGNACYETFYTGGDRYLTRSSYPCTFPKEQGFMYSIRANQDSKFTKCYLNNSLIGTIPYGSNVINDSAAYIQSMGKSAQGNNRFVLSELIIYDSCLNTTDLTNKYNELKTKWNF